MPTQVSHTRYTAVIPVYILAVSIFCIPTESQKSNQSDDKKIRKSNGKNPRRVYLARIELHSSFSLLFISPTFTTNPVKWVQGGGFRALRMACSRDQQCGTLSTLGGRVGCRDPRRLLHDGKNIRLSFVRATPRQKSRLHRRKTMMLGRCLSNDGSNKRYLRLTD